MLDAKQEGTGTLAGTHAGKPGLPRGRSRLPEPAVHASQRERLLQAAVAAVAQKGYPAVTVADIVRRWRALLWPSLYQDGSAPENLNRLRAWILPQLVALAQEAVSSGRKLMMRVEYRRNTRDADTGVIHRTEETRH